MGPLRSVITALAATSILLAPELTAQVDTSAPRAVADSFFRFIAAERFVDAARMMDLEALEAHRRINVDFARHQQPMRRMTVADLMRMDPKMPRSVAEYQARQFNERTSDASAMYRHEYGVSTLDSMATLPVEQLAARMLASRDERTMMRESLRRGGPCAVSAAEQASVLAHVRVRVPEIIGVVTRDSTAYALYDPMPLDFGEPGPDSAARHVESAIPLPLRFGRDWVAFPPSLLLLRRVGSAWKVGPSMDSGMSFVSGCDPARRKKGRQG